MRDIREREREREILHISIYKAGEWSGYIQIQAKAKAKCFINIIRSVLAADVI